MAGPPNPNVVIGNALQNAIFTAQNTIPFETPFIKNERDVLSYFDALDDYRLICATMTYIY